MAELVAATEAANERRTEEFAEGLHDDAFVESFLGSTTHVSALDADGICASVTCSNGTGSGLVVPGTGVHVNNMLGEEDLNPGGFHRIPPGRRVSSMMAPTVALRDGEVVLGLGSAGSNRIRSAILAVAVRVLEQGMDAGEAVRAPRVHFEAGTLQAEPGVDEDGLRRRGGARDPGGSLEPAEPLLRRGPGGRAGPGERRALRGRRPAPGRRRRLRLDTPSRRQFWAALGDDGRRSAPRAGHPHQRRLLRLGQARYPSRPKSTLPLCRACSAT